MKIRLTISNEILFTALFFIAFIAIYTFRNYTVGTDTINYIENFINYKNYNPPNILYKWIVVIINLFSHNARFFLFTLGVLILIPFFFSIKRYSPLPVLSVIVFAGFFYGFSLNIARQFIVMGFFYFLGISYIQNRKKINFLVLIGFMSLIHMVSLIYLPFYFFIHKLLKLRLYIFIWISSIILYSLKIHHLYFDLFKIIGNAIRVVYPKMPSYLLNPGNLILNNISIQRLLLYNLLLVPILIFFDQIKENPWGKIFFNLFFGE